MEVGSFLEFAFDRGPAYLHLDREKQDAIQAHQDAIAREKEKGEAEKARKAELAAAAADAEFDIATGSASTQEVKEIEVDTPTKIANRALLQSLSNSLPPASLEVIGQELLRKLQFYSSRGPRWQHWQKPTALTSSPSADLTQTDSSVAADRPQTRVRGSRPPSANSLSLWAPLDPTSGLPLPPEDPLDQQDGRRLYDQLQDYMLARRAINDRAKKASELDRRKMQHATRVKEFQMKKEAAERAKREKEEKDRAEAEALIKSPSAPPPPSIEELKEKPFDFRAIFGVSFPLLPFEKSLLKERYFMYKQEQYNKRVEMQHEREKIAIAEWENKREAENSRRSWRERDQVEETPQQLAQLRAAVLAGLPPLEATLHPLPIPQITFDANALPSQSKNTPAPPPPSSSTTSSVTTPGIPFLTQGDPNMYTDEALDARASLRSYPRLLKLLDLFWRTFNEKDSKHGLIKREYIEVHLRMQKALVRDLNNNPVYLQDEKERTQEEQKQASKARAQQASDSVFEEATGVKGALKRRQSTINPMMRTPTVDRPVSKLSSKRSSTEMERQESPKASDLGDLNGISSNTLNDTTAGVAGGVPPVEVNPLLPAPISTIPSNLKPHRLIARSAFDEKEAEKNALKDWTRDSHRTSGNANGLKMQAFQDALFELVDLWTETTDPNEYVEFLSVLYSRIARAPPSGAASGANQPLSPGKAAPSKPSASNNLPVGKWKGIKEIAYEGLGVEDIWARFMEREKLRETQRLKSLLAAEHAKEANRRASLNSSPVEAMDNESSEESEWSTEQSSEDDAEPQFDENGMPIPKKESLPASTRLKNRLLKAAKKAARRAAKKKDRQRKQMKTISVITADGIVQSVQVPQNRVVFPEGLLDPDGRRKSTPVAVEAPGMGSALEQLERVPVHSDTVVGSGSGEDIVAEGQEFEWETYYEADHMDEITGEPVFVQKTRKVPKRRAELALDTEDEPVPMIGDTEDYNNFFNESAPSPTAGKKRKKDKDEEVVMVQVPRYDAMGNMIYRAVAQSMAALSPSHAGMPVASSFAKASSPKAAKSPKGLKSSKQRRQSSRSPRDGSPSRRFPLRTGLSPPPPGAPKIPEPPPACMLQESEHVFRRRPVESRNEWLGRLERDEGYEPRLKRLDRLLDGQPVSFAFDPADAIWHKYRLRVRFQQKYHLDEDQTVALEQEWLNFYENLKQQKLEKQQAKARKAAAALVASVDKKGVKGGDLKESNSDEDDDLAPLPATSSTADAESRRNSIYQKRPSISVKAAGDSPSTTSHEEDNTPAWDVNHKPTTPDTPTTPQSPPSSSGGRRRTSRVQRGSILTPRGPTDPRLQEKVARMGLNSGSGIRNQQELSQQDVQEESEMEDGEDGEYEGSGSENEAGDSKAMQVSGEEGEGEGEDKGKLVWKHLAREMALAKWQKDQARTSSRGSPGDEKARDKRSHSVMGKHVYEVLPLAQRAKGKLGSSRSSSDLAGGATKIVIEPPEGAEDDTSAGDKKRVKHRGFAGQQGSSKGGGYQFKNPQGPGAVDADGMQVSNRDENDDSRWSTDGEEDAPTMPSHHPLDNPNTEFDLASNPLHWTQSASVHEKELKERADKEALRVKEAADVDRAERKFREVSQELAVARNPGSRRNSFAQPPRTANSSSRPSSAALAALRVDLSSSAGTASNQGSRLNTPQKGRPRSILFTTSGPGQATLQVNWEAMDSRLNQLVQTTSLAPPAMLVTDPARVKRILDQVTEEVRKEKREKRERRKRTKPDGSDDSDSSSYYSSDYSTSSSEDEKGVTSPHAPQSVYGSPMASPRRSLDSLHSDKSGGSLPDAIHVTKALTTHSRMQGKVPLSIPAMVDLPIPRIHAPQQHAHQKPNLHTVQLNLDMEQQPSSQPLSQHQSQADILANFNQLNVTGASSRMVRPTLGVVHVGFPATEEGEGSAWSTPTSSPTTATVVAAAGGSRVSDFERFLQQKQQLQQEQPQAQQQNQRSRKPPPQAASQTSASKVSKVPTGPVSGLGSALPRGPSMPSASASAISSMISLTTAASKTSNEVVGVLPLSSAFSRATGGRDITFKAITTTSLPIETIYRLQDRPSALAESPPPPPPATLSIADMPSDIFDARESARRQQQQQKRASTGHRTFRTSWDLLDQPPTRDWTGRTYTSIRQGIVESLGTDNDKDEPIALDKHGRVLEAKTAREAARSNHYKAGGVIGGDVLLPPLPNVHVHGSQTERPSAETKEEEVEDELHSRLQRVARMSALKHSKLLSTVYQSESAFHHDEPFQPAVRSSRSREAARSRSRSRSRSPPRIAPAHHHHHPPTNPSSQHFVRPLLHKQVPHPPPTRNAVSAPSMEFSSATRSAAAANHARLERHRLNVAKLLREQASIAAEQQALDNRYRNVLANPPQTGEIESMYAGKSLVEIMSMANAQQRNSGNFTGRRRRY